MKLYPGCPPTLKLCRSDAGSIILVVAGTLFCLFLFAMGYSQFLSRQSAMADRMSKKQKLSEVAAALAILTSHKLQFTPQTMLDTVPGSAMPQGSPALKDLFAYLAQPLSSFSSSKEFAMPLFEDATPNFAMLLQDLWSAGGFSDELVEEISIIVNRGDFSATGPAPGTFTREKTGNLRIRVNLKIQNEGKVYTTVDFNYCCPVRLCTMHAPVLSKFNLYIEDARLSGASDEIGYNQVSVNQFGNVEEARSTALPLVLNNDDGQNLPVKTEFRNFVEDRRGLVYLGGSSKLLLNLARSDFLAPNANSGEGFHFFRDNDGFDGFYGVYPGTSAKSGPVLLSFMDQGVSDDPDSRNASFYKPILAGESGRIQVEEGRMRLASLFRLFGVQGKQSATLVLGSVWSSYLSIARLTGDSGKPVNPPIIDNMSYIAPMNPAPYYLDLIHTPEYDDLRTAFGLDSSIPSYIKFMNLYASRIRKRPYNQALGFLHSPADSTAWKKIPESDLLGQFVRSANHPAVHAIPGVFAEIFPTVPDLKSMTRLLTPSVSLARISYAIDNPGNQDAVALLTGRQLVSNGRLAVNGWVKFKAGIKIDRRLEYLSNTGIVVENGDIIVSAPLLPCPGREQCLIYLVALNGNVIFDNNPGETVQAAVIANADAADQGRVVFKRPPASIRGALAMKKLTRSHDEAAVFKGTSLTYFAPLAALPAGSDGVSNDDSLLSFSFDQFPQELK
ncbi:MAG TPA: hypothetical protein PKM56_19860 [Candidatus Rifleibacterium sp.]|nr:hypothetical protein [Candidatus Rifleibacterium sp.]